MESQVRNDDEYFDQLVARFWVAFAASAGKSIHPECVQVAKDRGYYAQVKSNLALFRDPKSPLLANSLRCCRRAGWYAAEESDEKPEISSDDFDRAVTKVQAAMTRLRGQQGNAMAAGICSPG